MGLRALAHCRSVRQCGIPFSREKFKAFADCFCGNVRPWSQEFPAPRTSKPAYAGIPHQLPTPVRETPWLAKVDEPTAAGAKAQPTPDPVPSIIDQTLGEPALPGRHPDLQPTIGDTDGGPGIWQEPGGRNDKGVADQIFGTGITATGPQGYLLEYMINYVKANGSPGRVEFDGHLWRGHPPTEVFQEVKGNYDLLYRGVYDGRYLRDQAVPTAVEDWVEGTIVTQLQAIEAAAPGARLEWIFTHNEDLARLVEDALYEPRRAPYNCPSRRKVHSDERLEQWVTKRAIRCEKTATRSLIQLWAR